MKSPMHVRVKLVPYIGQEVSQLEYLKGTINYGSLYVRFSSIVEGYLDASLIINIEEHYYIKFLSNFAWGGAISWASKKQTCMKV